MSVFHSKKITWYIIFAIALVVGIVNNVIISRDDYFNLYSGQKSSSHFNFQFINESFLIAIEPFKAKMHSSNGPAQVAVGDLNGDGFEDFIIIGRNEKKNFIKVQINKNGERFTNDHVLEMLIWKASGMKRGINSSSIVDIDNDGWNDVVISYEGCVSFLKNIKGAFKENIIPTICTEGDKRNFNLLDANNDGFIDFYFSSFQDYSRSWLPPAVSNGYDGGQNILLLNQAGKSFIDVTKQYGFTTKALSWTAAISDFNNDGYPDILDINDFGYNHYYENNLGKGFINKTSSSLNIKQLSYSMSGEVSDFNNDGFFDIYVSNTNRQAFHAGYNLMLMNDHKGTFENVSQDVSTNSCGWAWGVKAFEPNRDLESALLVVNSPNSSENPVERSSLYSSPIFIRKFVQDTFGNTLGRVNSVNPGKYPEKNCLFYKEGKTYSDIAQKVGIIDIQGGKGLAEIDFNNDGISDFIIANIDSSPILYRGSYNGKNNWIGFRLKGIKSNFNSIGAVVEIMYDKGKKKKQIYPTNGYQAQSTSRLIFGVPENMAIKDITIKWPTGKLQKVEKYAINQYNEIAER